MQRGREAGRVETKVGTAQWTKAARKQVRTTRAGQRTSAATSLIMSP